MSKIDPTGTTTLRKRFAEEMGSRFDWLKGRINKKLTDEQFLDLAYAVYRREQFQFAAGSADKIDEFMDWLKEQERRGILTSVEGPKKKAMSDRWTDTYIESAYKKGMLDAYTKGGYKDMTHLTGKEWLAAGFLTPDHSDRVGILYTRAYNQLKGITDTMDQQISRVLAEQMAKGAGAREVAKALNERVDSIGKTRAKMLARTEIINAHAEATLNTFEQFGEEGVAVVAEWLAGHDGTTCPRCAAMDGAKLTLAEARGRIPLHPNCVAGDMKVFAPGALSMLKTNYTGQVIELVTVNGRRLVVTPAHVLLTKYGFARAESVYNGLDLVVDSGMYSGCDAPDYERDVPSIADEFVAAAKTSGCGSISMPMSSEHIHNEGRFCDEQVHVVFSYGVLWNRLQSPHTESVPDSSLPVCQGGLNGPGQCAFLKRLLSVVHASDSSMGFCRDALAFILSGIFEAEQIRLGAGTWSDAGIHQPLSHDASADVESVRDCLDRHPVLKQVHDRFSFDIGSVLLGTVPDLAASLLKMGFDGIPFDPVMQGNLIYCSSLDNVQFDKVIGVRKFHVESFPVYDVQTTTTAYSIGGIISSNCRCSWIPIRKSKLSKKTLQKVEERAQKRAEKQAKKKIP